MDQRRSLREWVFDAVAAIGLLIVLLSAIFRERGLALGYGYEDAAILLAGLALFIAGVAASNWYKKKRLSALIDAGQRRDHAN